MKRDSQRSKVYAYERSVKGLQTKRADSMSLEDATRYAQAVWAKERGRYGRPGTSITVAGGRGGGVAYYYRNHITLGVWARQPAVILHELAHLLCYLDPGHGPRFVGVAIGLYCRHMGLDRDELLAAAYEHGVKVNLTAIGATPSVGWSARVRRALELMGGRARNEMDIAVHLGVSYRVVSGALLNLRKTGEVRVHGRRIALAAPIDGV